MRVSEERAVAALRCLGQDIDTRSSRAGTAAELQVVVAVLQWLKSQGHQGEGTVPVPVRILEGSGFALRPAATTVYLDMELDTEEDVQEVVHEAVPSSTATFFGTELLSTQVLGPEPFTACGPSESITLRLRNILQEYGEESDLFTEMVQNAEDAGATVCRFLLDLRRCRKATSGLLDPGMGACHGPALWAYNNALFTEDDLRNITRVGAATKEGQAGRIGRFGLGFCSVYRVTDVPAVLSGETLLIFDPNGTHLGKHIPRAGSPGIRLDFSSRPRILHAFAEQFRPYHGIFGCRLPKPGPFPGSLFRLPFRTEEEALTSKICSEAFGTVRIQSLGTSFLGSNRLLLLFLRKVREMSLEMLPDTATSAEDTMPLGRLRRKEIRDLGTPGDPLSWAAIEQLTACEEASKTTWHYLVLVCHGDGELLELFHKNTQAGHPPSPPTAGVALPLAPTADGKWVPRLGAEEGQVFCHLPMPVTSGLSIHVHGAFSILSNRKGLWNTKERGEWNRMLLRNAVPVAWLRALDLLRSMHEAGELENYEYHIFWPDTNTACYPFTEAVTVKLIWTEDHAKGYQRAACILELLQDAVEERVNNTMQAAFQSVPFLPGKLPTGEHVLLPAGQLYLQAPLVGLIHPVFAPKVLGKKFSLPKEVESFLGLNRQIPAATVLEQLEALS
uniref:Sacsin/Nov domain-containing protein n=1 Tax=Melopsittacus undulatus TaxID=13146 RepID=A0A8V5GBG4_MELUD